MVEKTITMTVCDVCEKREIITKCDVCKRAICSHCSISNLSAYNVTICRIHSRKLYQKIYSQLIPELKVLKRLFIKEFSLEEKFCSEHKDRVATHYDFDNKKFLCWECEDLGRETDSRNTDCFLRLYTEEWYKK